MLETCPLCREPFDREDSTTGDKHLFEIRDGPRTGERIELMSPDLSVAQIAEILAARLDDDQVGSRYHGLKFNPSRLVLCRDGFKLESRHILKRSHPGKLSVQVEVEGWTEHIEHLERSGYTKLLTFFKLHVGMLATEPLVIPYELGLALKLSISLLQPVTTRGGSIIDTEIEQELVDVLADARSSGRSVYEALKYEFF
jgi:hypothetical protein